MTEMKMFTKTEYEYAVKTATGNGMWAGAALMFGGIVILLIVGMLVNV